MEKKCFGLEQEKILKKSYIFEKKIQKRAIFWKKMFLSRAKKKILKKSYFFEKKMSKKGDFLEKNCFALEQNLERKKP